MSSAVSAPDRADVLPAVVDEVPGDALLCLVDTHVHVFLLPERLTAFREAITATGRDLAWTSRPVTRAANPSAPHPTAAPSVDSRAGPG